MKVRNADQGLPLPVADPRRNPPDTWGGYLDPIDEEWLYPETDGLPMAQNNVQAKTIMDLHHSLEQWYSHRANVAVEADLLINLKRGQRGSYVAPDVFVALGRPRRPRRSYLLWNEGPPDFVMEIASPKTVDEDCGPKRGTYQRIGVQEYWQYDPDGGLLKPRLQGRTLVNGAYQSLKPLNRQGVQLCLCCPALALEFHFDGERLRLWDPRGKTYLLTPAEAETARQKEARRRRAAESARDAAHERRRAAESARDEALRQLDEERRQSAALKARLNRLSQES